MKPQLEDTPVDAPQHSGAELWRAIDELHTVSALLAGILALAEPGSPVERCLSVVSQALSGVIEELSNLA